MNEQLAHFIKTHQQLSIYVAVVVVLLGIFIYGRVQRGYKERVVREDEELRYRIRRDIEAKNKK